MSWEIHDRLSEHMTATSDCERAYLLGVQDAIGARELRVDDIKAAAKACAKRAMSPQKPVSPSTEIHGYARMRSHGALD